MDATWRDREGVMSSLDLQAALGWMWQYILWTLSGLVVLATVFFAGMRKRAEADVDQPRRFHRRRSIFLPFTVHPT